MGALGRTRPLLLGHRGARGFKSIPENTIASFDRALADGCDGFEFDVRLTSNGAAVICHDAEFKGIEIAQASIQQCAGLARLKEVLARYADRAFLDIELKVRGLEKITAALLGRHKPARGYVVSSFVPEVIESLHAEDNSIPLGLICESHTQLQRWNDLPVEYVIPHHPLAESSLTDEWKTAGKRILVWTVNSPEDMRRFRDLGVDGIISDNPKLLCETLAVAGDA
jgi:glycerophosphoryl diester phosphodiesterase